MPPRGRHFIKHGGSSMKEILLSQNKKALVDDAVYPLLSEFKWCYRGGTNNQPGYAVRNIKSDGKVRLLYLHHLVVPLEPGKEVIFLNHDRLDCRRENLLLATKEEARQHHRIRSDSKTGHKGVRCVDAYSWTAYVIRNGHTYNIGTFSTE